jgi:hypothetical protein
MRTGSSRWLFPKTAFPDGNMNSMTLPSISKKLYMRWTTPCAQSNCLNFASIKNLRPFRSDYIVASDH